MLNWLITLVMNWRHPAIIPPPKQAPVAPQRGYSSLFGAQAPAKGFRAQLNLRRHDEPRVQVHALPSAKQIPTLTDEVHPSALVQALRQQDPPQEEVRAPDRPEVLRGPAGGDAVEDDDVHVPGVPLPPPEGVETLQPSPPERVSPAGEVRRRRIWPPEPADRPQDRARPQGRQVIPQPLNRSNGIPVPLLALRPATEDDDAQDE